MSAITDEARAAAHEAATRRWVTGSSDTTQMLLSVDAALNAVRLHLTPQPECGAVDRTGQRRCVFTPGHHEVEDWTSHGDRGGWTWNDQPAEVKS